MLVEFIFAHIYDVFDFSIGSPRSTPYVQDVPRGDKQLDLHTLFGNFIQLSNHNITFIHLTDVSCLQVGPPPLFSRGRLQYEGASIFDSSSLFWFHLDSVDMRPIQDLFHAPSSTRVEGLFKFVYLL